MDEYDKICEWFVSARRPNIGVSEVTEFSLSLSPGSKILELGCGNGIPISNCLINNGFNLFVIDSSSMMIEKFRTSFPNVPAQCSRIQDSDFFNTFFDAVIAWGVFFHLTHSDQELAISKVSKSLNAGGKFLFTAGKEYGASESPMNEVNFSYLSLGSAIYSQLLSKNGMRLLDEHYDEWENYYYIAQKVA
jgi:2-polyprenyl-3-methyl-5-hydroxy-6-metoxy-1,4-benzoquinol methylase